MITQNDSDIYKTISLHSPEDRKRLKGMIDSCVVLREEIKVRQTDIADIRTEAKDSLGIPPKLFNRFVKAIFREEIQVEKREYEEFESILTLLKFTD